MGLIHVLTNRYSNARLGVNTAETHLTVDNVNDSGFGKLFTRSVDGDLYAQPLIVSQVAVGGTTRNVVYLATTKNSVYAYDADDPEACLPLWSKNLGAPMPRDDIFKALGKFGDHYRNFGSEIGITSTPAIDLDLESGRGILYVVSKTRVVSGGGGGVSRSHSQKIHALDLATGEHVPIPNNPVEIRATARRADGSVITLDPLFQLNRPGLLLDRGILYLAFGSHTDIGEFYGWIMAYDAATLAQLAVYNTAPDWGEGGIWQSGCGLASDDEGHVYAVVGNGEKPSSYYTTHRERLVPDIASPGGINRPIYGNCILKLKLTSPSDPAGTRELELKDWYTAPDVLDLNEMDTDLMSGPAVFDASGGGAKKLVLGGGKDGRFYLLDRDNLGHWSPLSGGTPSHWGVPTAGAPVPEGHMHHGGQPAPEVPAAGGHPRWNLWSGGQRPTNAVQDDRLCIYHIHGTPVIWKRSSDSATTAYVWSEKDALRAFHFRNGKFVDDRSGKLKLVVVPPGGKDSLPTVADEDTLFVTQLSDQLRFRIIEDVGIEVDKNGNHIPVPRTTDWEAEHLEGREHEIATLKERLAGLFSQATPTGEEAAEVITAVVSVAFPDRADPTTSAYRFPRDEMRMPGGFLALSSDGDRDGTAILWASHPTDDDAMNKVVKGTLRAYDARDLTRQLWTSDQDAYGSDRVGNFAKNVSPVVANGKVYLANFSRELAVYGLFSDVGASRIINAAGMFEFRTYGIDGRCAASCDRYDLNAAGGALEGTEDRFVFAYRHIDLIEQSIISITARLSGINTIPSTVDQREACAGIMIRKFNDDGTVPRQHYAALLVRAGKNCEFADNELVVQRRMAPRRASTKSSQGKRRLPIWLRLRCEKLGADRVRFRYQVSNDGADWKDLTADEMAMDGRVQVGLVAASQVGPDDKTPPKTQARFLHVEITPDLS